MENRGEHNFEEFLRESLENYEAQYKPDWNEMESRLDQANIINPSNDQNGILKSPLAKVIMGIALVGLVVILVINLLSDDKKYIVGSNDDSKQSIIDKLNSYKSSRTTHTKAVKHNYLSRESREAKAFKPQDVKSMNKNQFVAKRDLKENMENLNVPSSGIEQTHIIKAEGPTLDMLRKDYKDEKMLPALNAEFSASKTEGCIPLIAHFMLEKKDVAVSYLWDFGDGYYSTEANPTHIYIYEGRYNVSLTSTSLINQNLQTKSKSQIITVYKLPEVKFNWDNGENSLAYTEVRFVDKSTDVIAWNWDFGDHNYSNEQNPTHSYADEGSYAVKLIGKNGYGCLDTVASQIRILGNTLSNKFFAPNAFTPNGDGSNDEFRPVIVGVGSLDFEMSIYDRDGNLVYETDDIDLPWDGRMKEDGRIAPTGTYIWLVILKNSYGKQEKQIGQVTLIQ